MSKKVYIILSHTGTLLSTLIHLYTKDEFSHVSIALDQNLSHMYSFGRLNAYNPFIGGFIHEGINFGTFYRFQRTFVEIYSLEVTNEQYILIKNEIYKIRDLSKFYKFNFIGLCAIALQIKYRSKYSFYCAEFVKHVFDEANVNLNLPDLVKPIDFKLNKRVVLTYRGLLKNYKF